MKTVFPTDELVHIWAKQTQSEGRNSARNVFFNETKIYSYGHHFCMADIIRKPDQDGTGGIVLITSRTYSKTTHKHQSAVRYAVNHMERIFVPYADDIRASIKSFSSRIQDELITLNNPRKRQQTKDSARAKLNGYVKTIDRYFEVTSFDIHKKWISKDAERKDFLQYYKAAKGEQSSDELAMSLKKIESAEKAKATRKQIQDLAEWLGVSYEKAKDAAYQNGVYLRVLGKGKDQVIQTNRGASVSLKAGKLLFDMIKAGKDVKGHDIDGYTVISLNGVLKIGCHEIERTEIERFAKQIGWTK